MFEHIAFATSYPFDLGLICIVLAIALFYVERWKRIPALKIVVNKIDGVQILLLTSSLFISYFCATQLDFLNFWDEQFHVVVARNMAEGSFLMPYLYPPELPTTSETSWTNGGIWLHKPPFFMWQMALSMMMFGKSVLAFRLPYILLSAFATVAVFGIGKRLWGREVGLWAAILFSTNCYWLTIVSGYATCDANDVTFISYVTFSIWAVLNYFNKPQLKWVFLTGLFVAAAVLTKWYLGFWAIGMWFLWLCFCYLKERRILKKHIYHFGIGITVALLPALLWSLYIKANFPVQAAFESEYSLRHITEVIEGHGGGAWFHFEKLASVFGGKLIPLVFGLAVFMCFFQARRRPKALASLGLLVTVFVFFSIVRTKMDSFPLQVASILFCVLAFLVVKTRQWLMLYMRNRWFGAVFFMCIIAPSIFHHLDTVHLDSLFRIEGQQNPHIARMRKEKQAFVAFAQQITIPKGTYPFSRP